MTVLYTLLFSLFFFYCYGDHRDLHSFPTRRSSDLYGTGAESPVSERARGRQARARGDRAGGTADVRGFRRRQTGDRKSTRLNSSHTVISYAVFCLKKKKKIVKKIS